MTTSWQKSLRAGYDAFDALNEVILEQETRIYDLEELVANLKDKLDTTKEDLKNASGADRDEMAAQSSTER